MKAAWYAEQIADIWMEKPVHPQGFGYCRMEEGMFEILDEGETIDDIQRELEKQAISRGYDYHFHHFDDWDVEENITYHIIEWRHTSLVPVSKGE